MKEARQVNLDLRFFVIITLISGLVAVLTWFGLRGWLIACAFLGTWLVGFIIWLLLKWGP